MKNPLPSSPQKIIYILLGWIFLVIGVIGIFLPLLPTTPFLLLTAFCFDKGSPHFHAWLLNHKLFGPPIIDWQKAQVIRIKTKFVASVMIFLSSLIVLLNENIPTIGKMSYSFVILSILTFIWTRRSQVPKD